MQEKPDENQEGMDELLDEEASQKDSQLERLQELLTKEKDERLEERFFFIICFIILFDIVFFSAMDNAGGPIIIFILEIIILAPLASKFGIASLAAILYTVIDRFTDKLSGANKED